MRWLYKSIPHTMEIPTCILEGGDFSVCEKFFQKIKPKPPHIPLNKQKGGKKLDDQQASLMSERCDQEIREKIQNFCKKIKPPGQPNRPIDIGGNTTEKT